MPKPDPLFFLELAVVTTQLSRLLGMKFVTGSPTATHPLTRSLLGAQAHHNSGRMTDRDHELLRLAFFAKHLIDIERAQPAVLADFRKRFRRAGQTDEFYSTRFEVNVAATLSRKGESFVRGESPDFRLVDSGIGLECTSARLRSAPAAKEDYLYKLRSAVNSKAQKPYSVPNTCLAIDVTNILYNHPQISATEVRGLIQRTVPQRGFGAILVFFVVVDPNADNIQSNYIRADLPWIEPCLERFLDSAFPRGAFEHWEIRIPYEA